MQLSEEAESSIRESLPKAIRQALSDGFLLQSDKDYLEGMYCLSIKLPCQECRLAAYELIRKEINSIVRSRMLT